MEKNEPSRLNELPVNLSEEKFCNILAEATLCNTKPQKSLYRKNCGGISIVNSKCGKRIEFSKSLLTTLNDPENIQVLFNGAYLIIKATDKDGFALKKSGTKKVIYSAELVKEISEKFSINFKGHTCVSFSDFKAINDSSVLAAAILMK